MKNKKNGILKKKINTYSNKKLRDPHRLEKVHKLISLGKLDHARKLLDPDILAKEQKTLLNREKRLKKKIDKLDKRIQDISNKLSKLTKI